MLTVVGAIDHLELLVYKVPNRAYIFRGTRKVSECVECCSGTTKEQGLTLLEATSQGALAGDGLLS